VACMSAAGAPPKLQVPRWIQLIALPLLLLAAWTLASALRHALLIFLVSAVIAVLLNPIVHGLTRLRVPRGLAVLIVYLSFAAVLVGGAALVGAVVVDQAQSVSQQVQDEFTRHPGETESPAAQKIDRLQVWLDDHHLERVHVRDLGTQVVNNIEERGLSSYTKRALDITQTVATAIVEGLFNLVLILVISIYMLLDAPRISAFVNRMFPPGPDGRRLTVQVQRGLVAYVRGQAIVSLLIGLSAGVAMEVLGLLGIFPDGDRYALAFGAWAMVTEAIPYVGPILGAIPPVVVALFDSPLTALWVALVFLVIHQLEGHIIVPRVMGHALGAHPLAIIFGLLAGAELYGVPGVLLSLPLMAMGREVWIFLRPRFSFETWPRMALVGAGLTERPPAALDDPATAPPAEAVPPEAPAPEPPFEKPATPPADLLSREPVDIDQSG
jgi:predicted PurR-regulated permease PerM